MLRPAPSLPMAAAHHPSSALRRNVSSFASIAADSQSQLQPRKSSSSPPESFCTCRSLPAFLQPEAMPIVASAKKKDPCKDAANAVLRHCTPLSSRERGASTAAVDGDRVSQFALKWAADHILSRRHCFFLVLAHVRRKHTSLHAHGVFLQQEREKFVESHCAHAFCNS